jgi:hypothetical protein
VAETTPMPNEGGSTTPRLLGVVLAIVILLFRDSQITFKGLGGGSVTPRLAMGWLKQSLFFIYLFIFIVF